MSKEPNNIDRQVREKLDGFEMAPPPSVWNATEASLPQPSSKKRFFLWFFLGLSFIAFLSVGLYYFTKIDSQETHLAEEKLSNGKTESTSKDSKTTKDKSDFENEISSSEFKDDLSANENRQQEIDESNPSENRTNTNTSAKQNPSTRSKSKSNQLFDGERQSKTASASSTKTDKTTSNSGMSSGVTKGNKQDDKTNDLDQANQSFDDDGQSKAAVQANSKSNKSTRNPETGSTFESNSGATNGNGAVNDISGLSTDNRFDSLPIIPVQLLAAKEKEPISSQPDGNDQLKRSPFWKSFSIEGSVGMSTFKNQASKATDANFSNYLTQSTSNQLSVDLRFGLNYHFTPQLSVQSGIHYNSSYEDYAISSLDTMTFTYMDTVSSSVDSVTMDTTYIVNPVSYDSIIEDTKVGVNSYKLFTLPFQFAWSQTISKRGMLEFAMGGSISLYGRNSGSVVVDDSKFTIAAENAYRTSGVLSLGGSIKYLHRFGNHHSVYIEPWAQFGIGNQSTSALSYESFRRKFGVRFGYRLYF